jgi:hypothetical protein
MPPSRGAPAPSPADVTDGVLSTGVRSTYLHFFNGKESSNAQSYHPAKLQIEVFRDASCKRSLRWDVDLGLTFFKDQSAHQIDLLLLSTFDKSCVYKADTRGGSAKAREGLQYFSIKTLREHPNKGAVTVQHIGVRMQLVEAAAPQISAG